MSIAPRSALTTVVVAVAAQACASGAQLAPAASGDVTVETLRAEGPPALDRLLARWDAAQGADRDRLAALIDRVAAQRYATVSRLFWYTDLDAAEAAARASGKPILSLRMLGRLDEDRSCANSRFFRVVLYGNAELSAWLEDHFVLHWSSERPVPRLTIDYGDGRRVETTIAGNSAHYVLDDRGRVLDVIPGLMTPRAFRRELEGALGLVHAEPAALARHHAAAVRAIDAEWQQLGAGAIPAMTWAVSLAQAQQRTMAKAQVELPVVKTAALGPDPSKLPAADVAWEQIGVRLLAARGLESVPGGAGEGGVRPPPPVLDARSRALLVAIAPTDWARPGETLTGAELERTIAGFEAAIVADTALDLTQLRRQIHAELAGRAETGAPLDFASVNDWVYAAVFLTPAADAWLGIATPGVFTGLPADGVVVGHRS